MFIQVAQIDWKDYTVALPAFATIVVMPFAYSITAGIGAGTILYVILNLIAKKRKVHPFLIVCAVLFIIYFAQVPLNAIFAL